MWSQYVVVQFPPASQEVLDLSSDPITIASVSFQSEVPICFMILPVLKRNTMINNTVHGISTFLYQVAISLAPTTGITGGFLIAFSNPLGPSNHMSPAISPNIPSTNIISRTSITNHITSAIMAHDQTSDIIIAPEKIEN